MNIVVLEQKSIGDDIDLSIYRDFGDVTYYDNTLDDQIADRIKDAEVVIVNKGAMNESTLKNAEKVKLICLFATGYDNVDLEYCKSRGIAVANVVDYCTAAVAQHTFAMALYLLERLPFYDNYVKSGTYGAQERFSNFDKPFLELEGKTWGIIGLGNIGKKAAKIAEGFGCHVIYYSVTGRNNSGEYERVEFDDLLKRSDFISIHCPLSDLTRNLIDFEAMKKMKKTALLLNVARGPVVNNQDLYKALMEGEIYGAGLDVLEQEPIQPDNPLGTIKDSEKLIITPHMSWASTEARTRLSIEVYKNIEAFINGEKRNVVNL
ncbi:MAG: D-2-hydroxyacid dehydrogenase [Lachnospiraceae bacterium]|nr:D-2-hydroxyacid dehydrogenase [Lachnospiraceae bacterium]